MKKVMLYINAIHHGGAERVMVQLAEELTRSGYDTVLVTTILDTSWEYPLDKSVKRIILEHSSSNGDKGRLKKNISRLQKLRALCKCEKPDVLISFMPQPIMRALIATVGLPIKNIISIRNDPSKYWQTKAEKILASLFLRRAAKFVLQTEAARDFYKDSKYYERSYVICNPVDDVFFNTTNNHNSKTIITCGRLDKQKNHTLLIDAFEIFAKDHDEWVLKIYGVGPAEKELMRKIVEDKFEQKIILMGASDNVPGELSNAAIFVLSSDYEGLPNALMEALAAGVPSISTDCPCGGPASLIENGVNGILVPVNDKEAMANALKSLADDRLARCQYSINAKGKAEQYRKAEIIDQWKKVINAT